MPEICKITYMDVTPLADPALFADAMSRVPESRREKASSLRYGESQRLSLGVGLLLLWALEERGIDGKKARITEGEWGKPYLPDYPSVHFSLSHSGRWAMCAIGDRPIGCDVEKIGRGSEKLAKRFFHPEEQQALAALIPDTRPEWQREFARIWTRKESYLKADGRGISLGMESFSAVTGQAGIHYSEMDTIDGYAFACCIRGEDCPNAEWRETNYYSGNPCINTDQSTPPEQLLRL